MRSFDAWADESYSHAYGSAVYVVAAVTFEESDLPQVRTTMRSLRGNHRREKLHWSRMEPAERAKTVRQVADLGGFHIVTVNSPVLPRKEERARAHCLAALVHELHGDGRRSLCIEARQLSLDRRDIAVVRAARAHLPTGTQFHVEHRSGADEPLLWVADIVAGIIRAARQGENRTYRDVLAGVVYEVEAR